MDIRRETSIPEMIDFQIPSSWVPTTPVKPILPQTQPICADTQEKQLGHANWFAPERFSIGFSQETQALGCYDSTNSIDINKGFDNWEADLGAKSRKDFSMDSDRAKHVHLANLVALANAAVTNSADVARQGDVNAASSPFISIFNSQFEGNRLYTSSTSSLANQDISFGLNLLSNSSSAPDTSLYGNSIPSRPPYDLNSPPRALTDAFSSRTISSQLAPITPDLFKKAENKQTYDVHNLNVDERINQAREKQGNEVATARVEAEKLHHDKERQIPKDLSNAPVSTQLQENHNPDNGGNPGIDLNRTSQQKPRRKKHRPKVVIEGQPKRTQKPRTTKPAGSKENPTGKRKYVRKKGLNKAPGTPTAEVTGGSTDPETAPQAKSSRRTLSFDFKSQVREESSSCRPQSNDNTESQEQNFYTRVESKSTVQPDQGMGVMVIEAQQKRTPKPRTPIPAGSKENPTGKRKYVRKKGLNKTPGTPTAEVTGGSTDPETAPHEAKSCRRTLNFDFESQGREESSSCMPQSNDNAESQAQNFYTRVESKSTVQLGQGMEVMVKKARVGIAYDLTHSMNKVLEVYLPMPERQAQSPQSPTKTDPPHENLKKPHAQNECTRGKCQIVFSDETHDKQGSTIQMMMNTDTQSAPRSPNDSNCSSSACFIEGERARGLKRGSCTIDEAEPSYTNVIGGHYYSLLEYLPMFPADEYTRNRIPAIHFPAIHKKKRTEKGQSSTTSSTLSIVTAAENSERQATPCPLNNACATPYTPESNCRFSAAQFNTSSTSTKTASLIDAQGKQQTFECKLALDQRGRMTKKRSKGPTRVRNLASLIRIVECKQLPTFPAGGPPICGDMQVYEISHHPHTCMEALVADTRATMTTKKRTKRNFFASSLINNAKQKRIPTISAIVEYLEHLDINRGSKQNALVLYQRDGTIVPFEGSFDPIRKRRPRPKVDLDEETTRVWKLLLENINSEGIDGTNEAKAQWWEEERRMFRGRADSFIARMHLVQGDRRFSPWKGSVVDSVVGVFLTQNVSDHLSSSAFMSLAARFPLKSKSNDRSCFEETSILVKEPEVCILDPEDAIKWYEEKSNHPACDRSSMTLHDMDYNVEKEVVNSNELLGSSSSGVKSTYNLGCKCSDISKNDLDIYHKSTANRAVIQLTEAVESFMGDKREMDDVLSSQNSAGSSQNSVDSSMVQTAKRIGSFLQDDSEADPTTRSNTNSFVGSSFMELLQRAETLCGLHNQKTGNVSTYKENGHSYSEGSECDTQKQNMDRSDNPKTSLRPIIPSSNYHSQMTPDSGVLEVESFEMMGEESLFSDISKKSTSEQSGVTAESVSQAMVQKIMTANFEVPPKSTSENNHACSSHQGEVNMIFQSQNRPDGNSQDNIQLETQEQNHIMQQVLEAPNLSRETLDATESTSVLNNPKNIEHKAVESSLMDHGYLPGTAITGTRSNTPKVKRGRIRKQKQDPVDWDSFRLQAQDKGKRERTANTMDSLDWEAVRSAEVNKIADTIRERGMNNMLAERIKDFLNRLVREHGSIDLEWLRDVPPDKAKEYLLSFRGLGLKSVECVRLLTLHHLAFPVDTNVGRIAVRLGWVPLQPLPESLQLHLLELYPVLESIQRYLWPRLCKLDQRTLYELHYQMITFGKVFCTKSKPNCNACPMRGECRHFASAFASARLALPGPEEKSIVSATEHKAANQNPVEVIKPWQLPLPQANQQLQSQSQINNCEPIIEVPATPEPIVEVPATPEPEQSKVPDSDIEDMLCEDPEEIPTIKLNIEELTRSLQNYMQQNMELQEGVMSKALVALTPEAASIPMPKLKNVNRLRTEHRVYELPDSHPLLEGLEKREPDDPSPYLLAIWTPGETAISIQPPERRCSSQEFGKLLCDENTCFSCNSIREANSQTVRGTLLIPCRTAMRGSFPLNGTYFQVNEVFADHDSSIKPIDVPRAWIWNLPRRTVYFGTSIPTIFKGLSTENIQYCFWRGFVCVRGFDQKTRAPRPLMARLHFPASKLTKTKGKNDEKQE